MLYDWPSSLELATPDSILRTGTAEGLEDIDGEEEDEADVELGCGHCTKTGSKHYGAEWEQH